MRKVFINKWFFLAIAFSISLSTFSLIAYKKTQPVDRFNKNCCRNKPVYLNQKTDLLWDILSRQLCHFIPIH